MRPEPAWAAALLLPGEEEARAEIDGLRELVRQKEREIIEKQKRLASLTSVRRLLYEQDTPLEEAAWEALSELGAQVTKPRVKGKHDGTIIDSTGRPAVLETKGRRGSLTLKDVRELEQWRNEVDDEEGVRHKGLLIANLQISTPPAERSEDSVPPNCRELLKRYGFALLPTPQLFQAIVDKRAGRLDVAAFWNTLFETVGVTALSEPTESK